MMMFTTPLHKLRSTYNHNQVKPPNIGTIHVPEMTMEQVIHITIWIIVPASTVFIMEARSEAIMTLIIMMVIMATIQDGALAQAGL